MKKRLLTLILALVMCLSLLPVTASTASYNRVSKVSRNDGTWLFPVDKKYYNSFSDWAGCPGYGRCGLCGTYHSSSWGDGYHTWQAPIGHNGIDLDVPNGTAVYAAAAGTIAYTGSDNSRGNYVIIEHKIGTTGYSYYSYYQHLSSISVSKGKSVAAGDKIGASGNSGAGSGYHLHFGIVMAKSGTNIGSRLSTIEGYGWITTSGNREGRILNNPSTSSQFPTGQSAVLAPLAAHSGSVAYTFDKSKVTISATSTTSTSGTASTGNTVSKLTIKPTAWPTGTLTQGSYFSLKGTVTSNYNITSIKGEIINSSGKVAYTYTQKVNTKSFSFLNSTLDYNMTFNKLSAGTYYLRYTAVDSSGKQVVWSSGSFKVQASTLAIKPTAYPTGTLKKGSYFSLKGNVTSNCNITSVKGEIVNSSGKAVCSYTQKVNTKSFSFLNSTLDYNMTFNKLSAGTYHLRYTAVDSSGKQVTWSSPKFTVK